MTELKSSPTMGRSRNWLGELLCFLLISTSAAIAQLPTATILGVVRDSSGAVVPSATLTARNVDTGQTRTVVTGADGSFRFPALPVGNYEVRVEHPGFRSEARSGLALVVLQEAVVNFTLEVGAIEQTVAVTAEAPLVNTTSGSLGGLVSEQKMADLPLNGRNYIDLTLLQTGIQKHQNYNRNGNNVGVWFSSNGAPVRSNNYLLDGAITQSLGGTTSAAVNDSTLGVEGIREYRVITNFFSAEYGMTMGSQMVIVTKGGTNDFHGSLFEFLRNNALDARNFFDRKAASSQRRLPAFTRNNFGGSFGGPIQKDKLFFFGVYEGLRERLGQTIITNTIPSAAKADGGAGGVAQIAPISKPLLTLFPDPNLPNNQLTFPFSQPTREDYGQSRADYTISANDTMFGRYTIDDSAQNRPLDYPEFTVPTESRGLFTTVSENHIFSPALLNTFRFSFSRSTQGFFSPSGIIGPQFSFVPGKEVGIISIGGITSLGPYGNSPLVFRQKIFTWSDDLFYTRGRHALKFGTLINHYTQFIESSANNRGSINFANLTSFLLAQPISYTAITPGSILYREYAYDTLGFYGQDDLRVNSRLTLNLGLRYEFNTQVEEVTGHGAALRDVPHDADTTLGPPIQNSSLKNFSPRFGFAWDVKGNGKTAVRGGFGLLYDIGNLGSALTVATNSTPPFSRLSTVSNPPPLTSFPLSFPPSAAGKALRGPAYTIQQPHLLQYNLTVERQLPLQMALTLAYGGSRGINIIKTSEGNPTVPLGVPAGRTCVPRPAGQAPDINQPSCWLGNDPRTNPNWGTLELKNAGANSWYNSLQLGLTNRLSKGLQFQSSYTWSKTIDETQAQFTGDLTSESAFGTDPTHRTTDKGPSPFDIRQNWRSNAIYHFPQLNSAGGALGKMLNGWWVSGILSLQTGYPFTVALNSNRSRSGVNGGGAGIDRPDLVSGRNNGNITSGTTAGCLGVAPGRQLGTPNFYFDPCAFTVPAAGFLGTAGRNILRGPGLANLDFSLVKDTAIQHLGESGKLQFRAEFFNILNHPNFLIPSRNVFAATQSVEAPLFNAGVITSTAGSSRQIQFAMKLLF